MPFLCHVSVRTARFFCQLNYARLKMLSLYCLNYQLYSFEHERTLFICGHSQFLHSTCIKHKTKRAVKILSTHQNRRTALEQRPRNFERGCRCSAEISAKFQRRLSAQAGAPLSQLEANSAPKLSVLENRAEQFGLNLKSKIAENIDHSFFVIFVHFTRSSGSTMD